MMWRKVAVTDRTYWPRMTQTPSWDQMVAANLSEQIDKWIISHKQWSVYGPSPNSSLFRETNIILAQLRSNYWKKRKKRSVCLEVSFPFLEREKIQHLTSQFVSAAYCHHVKAELTCLTQGIPIHTYPFSWVQSNPKSEFQLHAVALLSAWGHMSSWCIFCNSEKVDAAFDSWCCLKIRGDATLWWWRLPWQLLDTHSPLPWCCFL